MILALVPVLGTSVITPPAAQTTLMMLSRVTQVTAQHTAAYHSTQQHIMSLRHNSFAAKLKPVLLCARCAKGLKTTYNIAWPNTGPSMLFSDALLFTAHHQAASLS
jgi:hypothetical protein